MTAGLIFWPVFQSSVRGNITQLFNVPQWMINNSLIYHFVLWVLTKLEVTVLAHHFTLAPLCKSRVYTFVVTHSICGRFILTIVNLP